jgi:hypothetical protein
MLARASEMEPTNSQLRVDYLKYQLLTVREWLRRGDEARAGGQPALAREMYLATLRIDPSNYRARRGWRRSIRTNATARSSPRPTNS